MKEKNMAPRMALWLKYYLDDSNSSTFLNKTASTKAAGYKAGSYVNFNSIGRQNYEKLRYIIEKWLDEEGITAAYLKERLFKLLNATQTKFFQYQGHYNFQQMQGPGDHGAVQNIVFSQRFIVKKCIRIGTGILSLMDYQTSHGARVIAI